MTHEAVITAMRLASEERRRGFEFEREARNDQIVETYRGETLDRRKSDSSDAEWEHGANSI